MVLNQSHVLKKYEKECQDEARYLEAEMAKHRVNDLKKYMADFKKEILQNYHLKEVNKKDLWKKKCEIEEAYISEVEKFNTFWDAKEKEFEENAQKIEKEFEEKQISKKELFLKKLDKGEQIKRNCITHEVLNL